MKSRITVLLISNEDDSPSLINRELKKVFSQAELTVIDCPAQLKAAIASPIDLALISQNIAWADSKSIIRSIKSSHPDCSIIVLVQTPTAVSMQAAGDDGVDDYAQVDEATEINLAARINQALGRKFSATPVSDALASNRIQELAEQSLSGLFFLDQSFCFAYTNPTLTEKTGYSQDELMSGISILDLCAAADRERAERGLIKLTTGNPGSYRDTLSWQKKDGSAITIEINATFRVNDDPQLIAGSILDVTEAHTREHEMGVVLAMLAALRSQFNREEVLPTLLDELMKRFDCLAAAIALRNPSKSEIAFELGKGAWSHWTGERVRPWEGITGQVISTGQPFYSDQSPESQAILEAEIFNKISAAACVPLIVQDQPIGVLWVGRNKPLSRSDNRLLSAIAEAASTAINRTVLNERTDQQLQRLTALRAIDMAINASLDVRVTLDILVGQVTTQLGIHAADVLLLKPNAHVLEIAAYRGFRTPPDQHLQSGSSNHLGGRAAAEGKVIRIADLRNSSNSAAASNWVGEDFVAYYAVPLIAKGQVKGVLELMHRKPLNTDPEWMDFLQTVTAQAAIAIDNAELFDRLQHSNTELMMAYDATIEGWSRALELRDSETQGHTERVAELTLKLARAMHLPEEELVHMRRGILLHDIGKMAIPDNILRKKGPLDEQEWEIMHKHAEYARDLLFPILYLRPAIDIPYAHHERWDGTGYPRGLKGEEIPLSARIFSVVDVWDALHSDRHYRAAWSKEKAMEHIRSHSGTQFDPQVVDAFLKLISMDS